ncbi:MAG: serine/threonine-protein kinase, partial [Acidobacteriota bacterium]
LTARMVREARAQSRLDHPNICKIYDAGIHARRPFILMELIEGEEIGALVDALPWQTHVALIATVADALTTAHSAGLVHRDIKPANIMVERADGEDPRPVLVDFGLVYEFDTDHPTLTGTRDIIGTPTYMAPEQIRAGARVDARADLYSLGATLYALLAGKPPFLGRTPIDTMRKILEDEPVALHQRVPGLPRALTDVVHACLARDPDNRPPSAAALATDLRRSLQRERPLHARSHRLHRLRRQIEQPGRRSALVALLIAVLGCGALIALQQQRSARQLTYEQQFGQLGNDLAQVLRAEIMSAPHDMRPARAQLRARLRQIERTLGDIDPIGHGPAFTALGRGYLALGAYETARDFLQQAWDLGHRTPNTAYALGDALVHLYRQERARVALLSSPAERETALDALEVSAHARIVGFLEQGRDALGAAPELIEAQIAFVEGDTSAALRALAAARQGRPWLYEAAILEGNIIESGVVLLRANSRMRTAQAELLRARDAYRSAISTAGSAVDGHLGLCRVARETFMLGAVIGAPEATMDAHMRTAHDACQTALRINADDSQIWIELANHALTRGIYNRLFFGRSIGSELQESTQHIKKAIALIEQELTDRPRTASAAHTSLQLSSAHYTLAEIHYRTAQLEKWQQYREDPRPYIDLGLTALARAARDAPLTGSNNLRLLTAKLLRHRAAADARYGRLPRYLSPDNPQLRRIHPDRMPKDPRAIYEWAAMLNLLAQQRRIHGDDFSDAARQSLDAHRALAERAPASARAHVNTAVALMLHLWNQHHRRAPLADALRAFDDRLAAAAATDQNDPYVWRQTLWLQIDLARLHLARGSDPGRALAEAAARMETPHAAASIMAPALRDQPFVAMSAVTLRAALEGHDDAAKQFRAQRTARARALDRLATAQTDVELRLVQLEYSLWARYARRIGRVGWVDADADARARRGIAALRSTPIARAEAQLWLGVAHGLDGDRAAMNAAFDRAVRASAWLQDDVAGWRCRLGALDAGLDGPRRCAAPTPAV